MGGVRCFLCPAGLVFGRCALTENLISEGKFDRVVELILQREGVAYTISGLRIEFRVEKFAGSLVDNRATIRVFNLNSTVREIVNRRRIDIAEGPYTTAFLSAGYRPDGAALIFRGVIIDGANYRTGPDWITEFTGYTAAQQTQAATCPENFTFRLTNPKVIADKMFSELNFLKPRYSTEALTALARAQPVTRAFAGRVDVALTKLLGSFGLVYTLEDDGPLVILTRSAINPDDAADAIAQVNADTGLINTPRITERGVEIRTLLNPEIKIFERFRLNSQSTDGSLQNIGQFFTAIKVEHFGSNRDSDFFTEVTGNFYPRIEFGVRQPDAPASFTSNPIQIGAV